MRHWKIMTVALSGALALSGCDKFKDRMSGGDTEVERAIQAVNVIDETNLNDIMLTILWLQALRLVVQGGAILLALTIPLLSELIYL